MSDQKPYVVYYHAGCSDGFGAAWAAWKTLGNTLPYGCMEFVPWVYGRSYDRIQKPDAERYYFLDCAPDLETYRRLTESYGKEVYVIDHHATAIRTLGGWSKRGMLDVTRSGAVLAWKFFHPTEPIPKLLQYVQDRDLWHHDLEDTQQINAYIDSLEFKFEEWDYTDGVLGHEAGREKIFQAGHAIWSYQRKEIERIVGKTHVRMIQSGKDLPCEIHCVNTSTLTSQVCHAILDKYPSAQIAGAYWMDCNTEVWSLRSRMGGTDVARFAEGLGGGGHPCSAGFRRPRP